MHICWHRINNKLPIYRPSGRYVTRFDLPTYMVILTKKCNKHKNTLSLFNTVWHYVLFFCIIIYLASLIIAIWYYLAFIGLTRHSVISNVMVRFQLECPRGGMSTVRQDLAHLPLTVLPLLARASRALRTPGTTVVDYVRHVPLQGDLRKIPKKWFRLSQMVYPKHTIKNVSDPPKWCAQEVLKKLCLSDQNKMPGDLGPFEHNFR